jgi:hypothetical protein
MKRRRRAQKQHTDERLIADAIQGLIQGKTAKQVAKDCHADSRKIWAYVREAFEIGLVTSNSAGSAAIFNPIKKAFPDVQFEIISAKNEFERRAARRILDWIKSAYEKIPDAERLSGSARGEWPSVAIGGGEAMLHVCDAIVPILEKSDAQDLRRWFDSKKFFIVNATAGGHPWMPHLEASKIAVTLGQALRKDVGVFSVSGQSCPTEKELIKSAFYNNFFIVSGVGEKKHAYCLKAMVETGKLSQDRVDKVAGEFLFHPFDSDGHPVLGETTDWLEIKEYLLKSPEQPTTSQTNSNALFATLFSFETLKKDRHRNPFRLTWPRYVVGVVRTDDQNIKEKAASVLCLLNEKLFTHICISSDLAMELSQQVTAPASIS